MDDADLFILHDDLQYTKQDWRNRNRIKTPAGLEWLTVPVSHRATRQLIQETEIAAGDWPVRHRRKITEAYRAAPYFSEVFPLIEKALSAPSGLLSDLNAHLLRSIADFLGITTPIVWSRDYQSAGVRNEKLVSLLVSAGATRYISGPSARAYIDEALFEAAGIPVLFKEYSYAPYEQLWGPFAGEVSVIDLLFNMGPASRGLIKSRVPLPFGL